MKHGEKNGKPQLACGTKIVDSGKQVNSKFTNVIRKYLLIIFRSTFKILYRVEITPHKSR